MKKLYLSYFVSVPAFVLGLVFLAQANLDSVTVTADSLNSADKIISAKWVLIILAIALILIAVTSILGRYVKRGTK